MVKVQDNSEPHPTFDSPRPIYIYIIYSSQPCYPTSTYLDVYLQVPEPSPSQDELLLEAALLGDAAALLDLLEQPPNGNPPAAANAFACGARCAWQGRAALHLAVQSESLEAVEVLLDKGAQVRMVDV